MRIDVYLVCPLYDERLHLGAAEGLGRATKRSVFVDPVCSSLIPKNCNRAYAKALNSGARWVAQLHSDIAPEPWWADKLIDEAERCRADFLSAVVPIKGRHGYTSTAIAQPGNIYAQFCHITQTQVRHPGFPDTFGINEAADALERLPPELRIPDVPREALLCNTGCMVSRLDRPWSNRIWFDDDNGLANVNGEWTAICQSEDWHFSRGIAALGGKVMATRIIQLRHWGVFDFHSHDVWGELTSRSIN